ncbi:MAG: hypothetical protein JW741_04115 [Sedimentisphaerales bacterium]|nr:hypothetical protein [Sedimentisphaerales bacterium]
MRIGKPGPCVRLVVMIGVLAAGRFFACPCAAAGETLEPLADHLSPPAFTPDHQAWLKAVIAEIPVLAQQIQALPAGAEPSKAEALKTRLAALRAEQQDLEAHRQLWETYRQETDSTPPAFVQGGKPASALDRPVLLRLCHAYLHGAEFIRAAAFDESVEPNETASIPSSSVRGGTPAVTLQSRVAPSAQEWEYLADRFERLLRTAQTTEGVDGALALHGRLLQGSCYLSASVEHFKAKDRQAQLRDYLRGIRVLDWVVGHDGIAPQLPSVGEVAGAGQYFTRWPQAHSSVADEATVTQARALLSDYCPWGARTYRALAASGLMTGFDWRTLPPYGSEKISVAVVPDRWLPRDVAKDMAPIVTGAFASQMKAQNFRWRIKPVPTYTVWFVSPRVHDLQASTVFTYALKANKLIFAGPEALLIDELKGLAFDRVGRWFGQGSGIHWASGHAGNLLGISLIDPHWLDPQAGWTFLVTDPSGVTHFKPSGALAPDWGDLFKGALMDVLKSTEKAEMNLLFESVQPNNRTINAAFGSPKTYDGSPMPGVILRGDTLGWQDMPDDRYRRFWHIVRYYRFDRRAVVGLAGLSETPDERASRKAAQWDGTTTWPDRSWQRLPEKPEPLGTRIHLNDFSPKAQLIRVQFPEDKFRAFRKKAEQKGRSLRVELVLPGELTKLGPIRTYINPVSEDLHIAGVNESFEDDELLLREGAERIAQFAPPAQDPNLTGEATFILMNAPLLDSPDAWVDLYSAKLNLYNVHRRRAKAFLTQQGVQCPPLLPHLLTEYTVRILLEPAGKDGGADAEELARSTVRLLPRPGKPQTGTVSDFGQGYLMFKQRYEGPVPELEDEAPALPLRRCSITLRVPSRIKRVRTYSDSSRKPEEGTQGRGKPYTCTATGGFSGRTFKGTWKSEKKSGRVNNVQTGSMTVTLSGPVKAFPPGAPKDRAVMLPTKVVSFTATLNTTITDSEGRSTTEHLTLGGSDLDLNEMGSTMLRQLGFNLKSVFDVEQRQHQYGFATLMYAVQGPRVGSSIAVTWSQQRTVSGYTEQQTLTETEGKGACTIAFQFH